MNPNSQKPKRLSLPDISQSHRGNQVEESESNWLVSYADMMTLLVGFFVILLTISKIDEEKVEELKKSISAQFGGSYQVPYADVVARLRETLKKLGLGEDFTIKQTKAGIDISFFGTVFFDSGSAELKKKGRELLDQLIAAIKEEKIVFDFQIEGHTDDRPIGPGLPFKNNWELSSLRACRVLDVFVDKGFTPKYMTAIGYGESRPAVPNRDTDGKPIENNMTQNRRVIIKLSQRPNAPLGVEAPPPPQPTPGGSP